jgi:hypothetical protein
MVRATLVLPQAGLPHATSQSAHHRTWRHNHTSLRNFFIFSRKPHCTDFDQIIFFDPASCNFQRTPITRKNSPFFLLIEGLAEVFIQLVQLKEKDKLRPWSLKQKAAPACSKSFNITASYKTTKLPKMAAHCVILPFWQFYFFDKKFVS